MKGTKFLLILIIFVSFVFKGNSQEIAAGIYSGQNFSDIHGNDIQGKWLFKPGPVEGINIDYSFNRIIGIRTGLSHSVIYYEHRPYSEINPWIDYPATNLFYDPSQAIYYPYLPFEMMNFSYVSVPAQLKISIPSKPQIDLSAGMFYSFLSGNSPGYEYLPKPAKNDFGYIYSAGLSYPLKNNLRVSLSSTYLIGRKRPYEDMRFRNGSIDFRLGLSYFYDFHKNKIKNNESTARDSLDSKIYIEYFGGAGLLWNSGKDDNKMYSPAIGPALGFLINLPLSPKSSFQTGLSFERTGYSLKDSSDLFYAYVSKGASKYFVDTKMNLDYIALPAMLNFTIGRSDRFFLNTGPCLGIKLNARCTGVAYNAIRTSTSYKNEKTVIYDDMDQAIRNCDFGWILGGGVTIPFSSRFVVDVGLQYKAGMINVFKKEYFSESDQTDNTIKNNVLSLRIGIRVPVLKRNQM
jgi:opacity protein-like surface antigen